IKKNPDPELNDLGFVQQAEIFDFVGRQTGSIPPVINEDDVLRDPERMLRLLCDAIGVEFSDMMLSCPAAPRETDGVWGKHWAVEVKPLIGFHPYRYGKIELPKYACELYQRCRECPDVLHSVRRL